LDFCRPGAFSNWHRKAFRLSRHLKNPLAYTLLYTDEKRVLIKTKRGFWKMKKETLEKIFEYASMPLHGTLSRKLRKDISCQINEEKIYNGATLFLGEEFVRITENEAGKAINTYYDWAGITSVRTIAKVSEQP
jgi:hypothetical protein